VHPDPLIDCKFYIHRLHILERAIQDFEEIVLMNWNCRLIKPFPDNFWDKLGEFMHNQTKNNMDRHLLSDFGKNSGKVLKALEAEASG